MALPLRMGERTFGALDVQSTQEDCFCRGRCATLSALADQITNRHRKTRACSSKPALALQEAEEAQRNYLRQEWGQLLPTLQSTSHEYHTSGVPSLGDAPLPEIEQAIQKGDVVALTSASQAEARSALAVPIKLRDQLIGVIDCMRQMPNANGRLNDVALVTAVAEQAAWPGKCALV